MNVFSARAVMDYTSKEIKLFKKLNTPQKIQNFLGRLTINFEEKGETCYSPRIVIKERKAHCMEGAMLAAAALEFHGRPPLVMDLRANDRDFDHVVAVFKQFGCFGAISKTNHAVLRYREPIYRSVRELALSFFHEYFDDKGKKNLREFSKPLDLRYFDPPSLKLPPSSRLRRTGRRTSNHPFFSKEEVGGSFDWRTSTKNLFQIPDYLDRIKHYPILSRRQIKSLRRADKIEITAGKLVEWKKS